MRESPVQSSGPQAISRGSRWKWSPVTGGTPQQSILQQRCRKKLEFRIDQQVNPAVTTSRIVTEPLESLASDLETLSAGITPENLHSKIDYFEAVGKEAF